MRKLNGVSLNERGEEVIKVGNFSYKCNACHTAVNESERCLILFMVGGNQGFGRRREKFTTPCKITKMNEEIKEVLMIQAL